jgi:hypothetical protein
MANAKDRKSFQQVAMQNIRSESSGPSKWMSFLQSASGTALITVLLGTIGGGLITQLVQWHAKDRDARSLAFTDYLKAQEKLSTDAFTMIGKSTAAAEDMAVITEKQFYTGPDDGLSPANRAIVEKQKIDVAANFNAMDTDWRRNRDSLRLFMRLDYRNDAGVAKAWDQTSDALTTYMDCEREFNLNKIKVDSSVAENACADRRSKLQSAENDLATALTSARAYSW